MASKIIRNLIAILWIGIVIYYYFINHNYYLSGWHEIGSWLLYLLLIPLIYTCYALYKWFNDEQTKLKFKLTFPRLVAGIILFILITGNAVYIVRDPSFYTGDDLIYSVDEYGMGQLYQVEDILELEGHEQLLVHKDAGYEQTTKAFEWMPEYFHEFFVFPKFLDIQIGLLSKSLAILLILGLITITSIGLGFTILKKSIGKETKLTTDNALVSFGLGLFGIILLMFILGSFHFLNIYTAWGLFVILNILSWKSAIKLLKKIFTFKYEFETKIFNINLLIILVIAIVLCLNFIDNISPIPRGWDGLNQYVNIAKRISEANGLITMGGNYYWELLMSLGFIMFDWTTITLNLASFFPATISLFALYIVLRKFVSNKGALFGTAALYLTPMMLFHGVEDNKVDAANFAMSIIAFLSLYLGITSESKKERFGYIAIGGLLCGFCFGIKVTSIMVIFAAITMLLYKAFKTKGAIAGTLLGIGIIFFTKLVSMGTELVITSAESTLIGGFLILSSILLITFSALRTNNWKGLKPILLLAIFSVLAFSPWMIKNYTETGSLSYNKLLTGLHPQPTIDYELLEEEYGLDPSLCQDTGTFEELDRYLGYTSFYNKYLTMAWHTTMDDQGTKGIYIDIGWTFLALAPLLLLFTRFKRSKKWEMILWFGLSYWAIWVLTGNGIIWYGLPGFLVLTALVGAFIDNYEKENEKAGTYIINIIIVIFLISSLVMRLGMAGKGTLLLYVSNMLTSEETQDAIFPSYGDVQDIFSEDQDGQYDLIWKVGTPLNYFIEDNFWRTHNDQYLDNLNCLYIERDPELLTERLKALGYGYILFDYFTYSLSPDPESTLAEKYNYALDYLLNYTEIVVPDNYRGHIVAKIVGT